MQGMKHAVVLLLVIVSAAACASGRAQIIEDRPTLAVPPVPARTIEPPPQPELPPVEPIPETSPVAASAPKPKPAPRNTESKPAEPKPDTSAETPTGPVPPAPVAPLRSSSTPTGPEAARQVRDTLSRAEAILSRVDYQKLSDDRRATYNSAKNYIQQAEEKIKQDDLQLALNFALRAENIAQTLLSGGR